ncbi:MAG TPA: 3-phosphoshikimate 1-carboxyvinyltransferase [Candidatus Bathyarchaeia archaeon]|nr:3-phosphoshikimate 1-carboxyvinyltransferase [Candidatus Bathyarchaeia archaeon]
MDFICNRSTLSGEVAIPGSKSHAIRAVSIGALADGESRIECPLDSADARSAVHAYRGLGAVIATDEDTWTVTGVGGRIETPEDVIDIGNSGTSLNVALGSCALLRGGLAVLTGDGQIRRRPSGPLAQSLTDLGARVRSTRGNGCPPFVVQGRLRGGETSLEAVSSQYLTSLLINAPLGDGDSRIRVPLLHERPYVEMTLDWLRRQGVRLEHDEGLREFHVPGGQGYKSFERRIPGDFSTATFFLCAGAIGGNQITSLGLDMNDTQGDKAVVDYIRQLGAQVEVEENRITVRPGRLRGCEIDLNATPDVLPMMAVLACFAEGTTRLVNVPQARIKETDRLTVMHRELERLGARVEELADGLVVTHSDLCGADVDGHGDHRIIMALAIAGTMASGKTRVRGADAVDVTFPGFIEAMTGLGAEMWSVYE